MQLHLPGWTCFFSTQLGLNEHFLCSMSHSKQDRWSSKVAKCFEHLKCHPNFASHIDSIWCVQLVDFSLDYAGVVIALPYISDHVVLLWEQSNGSEASDVYQYFLLLFTCLCLQYACSKAADKKITLTGWVILVAVWLVSRFVASPLVDSGSQGGVAAY